MKTETLSNKKQQKGILNVIESLLHNFNHSDDYEDAFVSLIQFRANLLDIAVKLYLIENHSLTPHFVQVFRLLPEDRKYKQILMKKYRCGCAVSRKHAQDVLEKHYRIKLPESETPEKVETVQAQEFINEISRIVDPIEKNKKVFKILQQKGSLFQQAVSHFSTDYDSFIRILVYKTLSDISESWVNPFIVKKFDSEKNESVLCAMISAIQSGMMTEEQVERIAQLTALHNDELIYCLGRLALKSSDEKLTMAISRKIHLYRRNITLYAFLGKVIASNTGMNVPPHTQSLYEKILQQCTAIPKLMRKLLLQN